LPSLCCGRLTDFIFILGLALILKRELLTTHLANITRYR